MQFFQNYKAIFTILDIPEVSREWINDLEIGTLISSNTPKAYKEWVQNKNYRPLITQKSVEWRTREEQLPSSKEDIDLIQTIYNHYDNPYEFEKCAAEIVRLMDQNVLTVDLTRPWVDGGRDGLGKYKIGHGATSIEVDFAMEAKRYDIKNSIGVKETSRLISRIRQRQFGILVTTSYVHKQAYKEITDDGHPIIILSAVIRC